MRLRIKKVLFQAGIVSLSLAHTSIYAVNAVNLRDKPINTLERIEAINFTSAKLSNLTINFKEISREFDQNQTTHVRVQQYVGNVPVLGSDFIIHIPKTDKQALPLLMQSKSGTMNGTIYAGLVEDLQVNSTSVLNEDKSKLALEKAMQLSGKKNISDMQNKLVVYIDNNKKAHWAYVVHLISSDNGEIKKLSFIIDAITLQLYHQWNGVKYFEIVRAGGEGGAYNEPLFYDDTPSNLPAFDIFRDPLKALCYMRNDHTILRDMRNNLDVVEFGCQTRIAKYNNLYWNDANYINGAVSPDDDIFFAATQTQNMFKNWYGTSPWVDKNGKEKPILFWAHQQKPYGWSSSGWKQYAGCVDDRYVLIGDGDDGYFPFSQLDVVSHEIAHGFTFEHSNLSNDFETQEAAAIDESFSDMTAKAVEYYVYGQNKNWNIGHVYRQDKDRWQRFMDDPTKDCQWKTWEYDCSIDNVQDMRNRSWIDARYASGIFNKAFYLMSTASNSNTHKAFDVMVKANKQYWTSNTTFCEAAKGVAQAAKDLNFDLSIVKNAFLQVGINIDTCKDEVKGE